VRRAPSVCGLKHVNVTPPPQTNSGADRGTALQSLLAALLAKLADLLALLALLTALLAAPRLVRGDCGALLRSHNA
jgi:hypothetical protein